jgi:hypothetical protein
MAVTVDYSTAAPWLITVPKADLTLLTGTQYQLTVDGFWILLRDFSDNENPMARPILYTRINATSSTPSITEIDLTYYQIEFEDGLYSVNIVNGNTNIREAEVKNQVSVNTNNTTGFIDPVFLEQGLFGNAVTIDVTNGVAGVGKTSAGGIIGTVQTPSNNTADSLAIAAIRGLDKLSAKGDLTVDSGLDYTNFIMEGQGQNLSVFTITNAALVVNCTFRDATVSGTLDGEAHLEDCIIDGLTFISGVIDRCLLNSPVITLGGGADATFTECGDHVIGVGTPEIHMGGSGQSLSMLHYRGGVKLTNKTGTDSVEISLSGGTVILDSATVTGTGTILVHGVGKLIDESGNRIATGTWNTTVTIVNELVDYLDTRLARQWAANRVVLNAAKTVVTMYEDDGVTVAAVMNVTVDGLERVPA